MPNKNYVDVGLFQLFDVLVLYGIPFSVGQLIQIPLCFLLDWLFFDLWKVFFILRVDCIFSLDLCL